jgi:hypothetical protein
MLPGRLAALVHQFEQPDLCFDSAFERKHLFSAQDIVYAKAWENKKQHVLDLYSRSASSGALPQVFDDQ